MLFNGTIPLTAAEREAVTMLKQQGGPVSITRRDPGEQGPLLVHVGDSSYVVDENGWVQEV